MTATTIAAMTTGLIRWVPSHAVYSLGWALLHFLWQGTALAAVAGGAMAVCRRASLRYVVGVTALALMLLEPVATFFYCFQDGSGAADAGKPSPLAVAARPMARGNAAASGPAFSQGPTSFPWWRKFSQAARSLAALPWLVEAWLVGVALLSLRTAGGFLLLERERRRPTSVVSPQTLEICRTLQRRLGIDRAIAFCQCQWLEAPAVIGWFRPMVFLPVGALTGLTEEQLQSVIAHELGHIRRFDPFVNVFQVLVETLLFYHPAVWWLNKKIRTEREHCCDDVAVSVCGNAVEYARALTLMEQWRTAPDLAMAATRGPLTERIVRLLGLKTLGAGVRGLGLIGSLLCLTAAIIAGNALSGMAHPTAQAAFFAQAAANAAASAAPEPASKPAPSPKPSPAHPQTRGRVGGSYIDEMKAAGLGDLTVDQLIALKIQDVTAEYIRALLEQGVNANAEKIVAMRIQGITPEYIRDLRAAGIHPDEEHLIALKIQGVNVEYYQGIKEAGIEPDVQHLIAMKIQGVTPEYIRALQAAGLTVTAGQVIALKIQGVTPTYLKEMHEQGIDPRTDDAIAMRIQGVTPEYVRAIHALGLKPSTHQLIAMRVQDVTPEYIQALQAAGLKVEVNDVIRAKVQDVTPEFIERARQHGFKDLPLDKLIRLRQFGILDSKADL